MNKENKIYPYYEYGNNGNISYFEDSTGFWYKKEYDKNGNRTYYKDSDGYWITYEFDKNNNEIYYENSNGCIIMGNWNDGIKVRIR